MFRTQKISWRTVPDFILRHKVHYKVLFIFIFKLVTVEYRFGFKDPKDRRHRIEMKEDQCKFGGLERVSRVKVHPVNEHSNSNC